MGPSKTPNQKTPLQKNIEEMQAKWKGFYIKKKDLFPLWHLCLLVISKQAR